VLAPELVERSTPAKVKSAMVDWVTVTDPGFGEPEGPRKIEGAGFPITVALNHEPDATLTLNVFSL